MERDGRRPESALTALRLAAYLAIGVVAYLAALAAMAPATVISRVIERASREVIVLREPSGTAWNGSGRLFVRRGGGLLELGTMRWSASLSELLSGKVIAQLVLGEIARGTQLELSPASVTVRKLELELPAAMLSGLAPELEVLDPGGKLRVRSDNLRFAEGSVLGLADIEWREVRLGTAQKLPLGSHVARLRGGGGKVDIDLASLEGPLRLSGGGTWDAKNGLAVTGMAEPARESDAALVQFLKGVCSEFRDSRCVFRLKR